jgi:hypothetical protein
MQTAPVDIAESRAPVPSLVVPQQSFGYGPPTRFFLLGSCKTNALVRVENHFCKIQLLFDHNLKALTSESAPAAC